MLWLPVRASREFPTIDTRRAERSEKSSRRNLTCSEQCGRVVGCGSWTARLVKIHPVLLPALLVGKMSDPLTGFLIVLGGMAGMLVAIVGVIFMAVPIRWLYSKWERLWLWDELD